MEVNLSIMTKDQLKKFIVELDKENKKLEEKIRHLEFDVDAWHQLKLLLEWEIKKLKEENDTLFKEKAALREYCDELDSECDDLVVTKELLEWQLRELTKEHEKLKEKYDKLDKVSSENVKTLDELEAERIELAEENKILKETIKDHQLYEEKLEHRIIEFEELLHWE